MAKNTVPRGETSVIRHVFIMDSTSTAGAGKTDLAHNTASLTGYYIYPGGTPIALTLEDISTLGTYAAPTSSAHLRFKEVSKSNMPGWYELHFHNDWFSVANARRAACVQLKGATGMAPLNLEIDCIGMEIQSAAPDVNTETITPAAISADSVSAAAVTKIQNGLATPTNITAATGVVLSATGADLILKNSPFAIALADAVWDEPTSGHTTIGSAGKVIIDTSSSSSNASNYATSAYNVIVSTYNIVNHVTHGNSALRTLINDTVVNGDHGLVSIQDDLDEVLIDTGELQQYFADMIGYSVGLGHFQFLARALALAPSGGDATAANQTTIINHLAGIKGAGWTDETLVSLQDAATLLRKVLEADRYIETTTTPWQLVLIEKDSGTLTTGTRLLVQQLKNVAGADVTATSTVIGQSVGA